MHRIIENLRARAVAQAVEWTEENALSRWEKFLTVAFTKDDWLGKHFLLGNLESKMQQVFKLIDSPKMHQLSISYFRREVNLIPKKYWHIFYDPPETLRAMIEKYNILAQRTGSKKIIIPKIHKKRQKKKREVKKIGVLEKLLT